jgi:hypothetical protein
MAHRHLFHSRNHRSYFDWPLGEGVPEMKLASGTISGQDSLFVDTLIVHGIRSVVSFFFGQP